MSPSPPFLRYKDSLTVNTKPSIENADQSTDHHRQSSFYNTSLTPSMPLKLKEKHSIERIDNMEKLPGRNSGKTRHNATIMGFDRTLPLMPPVQ